MYLSEGFECDMQDFADAYNFLIDNGYPKEDARYILPNACETSLYLSCNLRELIHICNERLCSKAQWEIRNLVKEMKSLVTPELHFMLVPKCKSGRILCNSPCGRKEETNE
jgi:thymidylate synthase (FAD)